MRARSIAVTWMAGALLFSQCVPAAFSSIHLKSEPLGEPKTVHANGSAGASPTDSTAAGKALTADDLRKDARLQKEVTLHLPNALIDEVLQELSKQTGIAFTIDPALAEEKATLFVKNKPAWQVLEKLTTLLDIRCEKDGEGYHLSPDPKAIQQERATLEWERSALRRNAERMLREWAGVTSEDYLVLRAKAQAIEEELARLRREKPPGWQDLSSEMVKRNYLVREGGLFYRYLAGWLYQRLPQTVWQRLWNGEPLWFSIPEEPGALPLPADALRWATTEEPNPQMVRFTLRLDRERQMLFCYLKTHPVRDLFTHVYFDHIVPEPSVNAPLRVRWERWDNMPESLEGNPKWNKQIPVSTTPALWGRSTPTDWLLRLAQSGGINVIADAFRLSLPESVLKPGKTLLECLDNALWHGGYVRVEDDWLLFRHPDYWRLKRSELPERLVRAMERKAREEGLSLEDYAALAHYLTPERTARLEEGYAARFDITPLREAAPALRFWASLTADQKKAALQRQPLPYVSLTPAQQKLFREAMLAKLYEEPKMILFDALNNPEAQAELAFAVDRWREAAYTLEGERVSIAAESPEELQQQRHLVPDAPDRQQQAQVEQITFYFGLDSRRSTRYDLPIRKKSVSFSDSSQETEESPPKILSEK